MEGQHAKFNRHKTYREEEKEFRVIYIRHFYVRMVE